MEANKYAAIAVIDPGASGAATIWFRSTDGISVVRYVGDASVSLVVEKLKRTAEFSGPGPVLVVLEEVHASPIMAPSKAFAFGDNFGAWRCALKSHGFTVFGVTPQQWQRELNLVSRGDARKSELKEIAAHHYPKMRVTLVNADALLILRWVRQQVDNGAEVIGKLL